LKLQLLVSHDPRACSLLKIVLRQTQKSKVPTISPKSFTQQPEISFHKQLVEIEN